MSENMITLSADDKTAAALVATIRAAVNGQGKYATYVAEHGVTRENVKHHALALATLAYPNDKPVQKIDGKRTRFGNAVQAAGYGLRNALPKTDSDTMPDYLKKVIAAVKAAHGAQIGDDTILAAVESALSE